jgi:hydroxymethylpyrimidine/phosphomethylpyrimidine kinase
VVLKGGHLDGAESIDVVDDGTTQIELRAPRIVTRNTHGTGCTLAAAIAALLPQRDDPNAAIAGAKAYLSRAIAASGRLEVGSGHGPVHHFHAWWPAA